MKRAAVSALAALALLGAGCARELPTIAYDSTPPATTTDLTVRTINDEGVVLAWTAPGDDGTNGRAQAYEIRQRPGNVGFNWDDALPLAGAPLPGAAGVTDSAIVTGLQPDTSYLLALRTIDAAGNVSGTSNAVFFRTTSSLRILAPAAGDGYCNGDSIIIRWPVLPWSGDKVRIELSNYYGYSAVLADSARNEGRFAFADVFDPDHTDGYSIHLEDLGTHLTTRMDGHFTISREAWLSFGDNWDRSVWCRGRPRTISWLTSACTDRTVSIELHDGQGLVEMVAAATENDGTFDWLVGDREDIGALYRLRIAGTIDTAVTAESPRFSIRTPCVPTITSPAAGDTLANGMWILVEFTAEACCSQHYRVELFQDGEACAELGEIWYGGSGSIDFTVAGCGDPGRPYFIRITDAFDGAWSESGAFHIVDGCRFRFSGVSPSEVLAGHEVWTAWQYSSACGSTVDIDIVDDTGYSQVLAAGVPNQGYFNGVMPPMTPGRTGCRIRLRDTQSGVTGYSQPLHVITSPVLVKPDGTGDYATIADAVRAVGDGFVIELDDGVFDGAGNGEIVVDDRILTIRSRSGVPEACVIRAPGSDFIFKFVDCAAGVTVEGLTIRDYWVHLGGTNAVLAGVNSRLNVSNCRFHNLRVTSPTGSARGGAISLDGSQATIRDCLFHDIRMEGTVYNAGGGIHVKGSSVVRVEACTFAAINSFLGAAVHVDVGALTVERCIVFGNRGTTIEVIAGSLAVSCCDVFGNGDGDWVGDLAGRLGSAGNISLYPGFCDLYLSDYRLQADSPCRAEANDCGGGIGAFGVGCE